MQPKSKDHSTKQGTPDTMQATDTKVNAQQFKYLPLSLNVETQGGIAVAIVRRGTALPVQRSKEFTTASDNQESVEINVSFGESPIAEHNLQLGKIALDGIPKCERGKARILVSFSVDKYCKITTSAKELNASLIINATFNNECTLLNDDVVKRILDSNANTKDKDAQLLEIKELKINANLLILQAEKQLKKYSNNGINSGHEDIEVLIADIGLALEANDHKNIKIKSKELDNLLSSESNSFLDFMDLFTNIQPANSKTSLYSTPSQYKENRQSQGPPKPPISHNKGTVINKRQRTVFGSEQFTIDPKSCFVLMPFSDHMKPIYEDHIKPIVESISLNCIRADEIVGIAPITRDIWESINKARFLIADLTGKNANVFYEVGLAHAIGKDVILITQTLDDVPFDLKVFRCIQYTYDPRSIKSLESKLRATIQQIVGSKL